MTFDPFLYIIVVMEIIEIKAPIYKFKVFNHSIRKQELLDSIQNMGIHSCIVSNPKSNQRISNTDYHLRSDIPKNYISIIQELLSESLNEFSQMMDSELDMKEGWFQQYEKGDEHGWHDHPDCQFSSVYYVELPKDTQTRFKDYNGEEFTIDVSEGDYIIFPSFLYHRSAPNTSDDRKTIYANNINLRSM